MTNLKDKLINRSNHFLKEKIQEQKLKILLELDEGVELDLDSILLKDIVLSKKDDFDGNKTLIVFKHIFIINENQEISIDVLESDAQTKQVAPTDDYGIFYDRTNGSDIHRDYDVEDQNLTEVLNSIDYSEFFNEDFNLTSEFITHNKSIESEELFNLVKESYLGLKSIEYSGEEDDFVMYFSTGAELCISKRMIQSGHYKAIQNK